MVARKRGWRLAGLASLGFAAALALSGCSFDEAVHGFGWFKGITPQGRRMYELWIGSCIAALVVGVFVWGLIFWCIVRYRKRSEELPPQTRFNMPLEFLYTFVPFLVVSVLFYYTAVTQTYVDKKVLAEAERFTMLRADITHENETTLGWAAHYEVQGVPTVLFIDSTGKEVARLVGYVGPEDMIGAMRKVR